MHRQEAAVQQASPASAGVSREELQAVLGAALQAMQEQVKLARRCTYGKLTAPLTVKLLELALMWSEFHTLHGSIHLSAAQCLLLQPASWR